MGGGDGNMEEFCGGWGRGGVGDVMFFFQLRRDVGSGLRCHEQIGGHDWDRTLVADWQNIPIRFDGRPPK